MARILYWVREAHIAYLEWALSEIDPLHGDIPYIVSELCRLRQRQSCTNQ